MDGAPSISISANITLKKARIDIHVHDAGSRHIHPGNVFAYGRSTSTIARKTMRWYRESIS